MTTFLTSVIEAGLLKAVLVFSGIFITASAVLFALRKLAFGAFYRWAGKTETRADDIILDSVRHPSLYWVLAIGLYVALDTSDFPAKYVGYGLRALHLLIILSVSLAAANITSRLFSNAIGRAGVSVPATGLSITIIKAVILGIGLLITLNTLGISITPLLTALGVGGLAVALALQDTLSNLFAGMHIIVEKPVKVNDYIRLHSGEEGSVIDIGWRTTRVREPSNNIVIIPNKILAQSTITNFSMPVRGMISTVKVTAPYSADPDLLESALAEEAVAAADAVKGILKDPLPAARLSPGFGEAGLEFTVVFHIAGLADQQAAQHEIRKRILKRFKKEGIEFPFPSRTVRVIGGKRDEEGGEKDDKKE